MRTVHKSILTLSAVAVALVGLIGSASADHGSPKAFETASDINTSVNNSGVLQSEKGVDTGAAPAASGARFAASSRDNPCGDANGDGVLSQPDAVYIISYLFQGGPAPNEEGDCDGYELINLHDAAYITAYVFCGGPAPICPPPNPPCKDNTNTDFTYKYTSVLPANASSIDIAIYLDHKAAVLGVTLPVTVRVEGEVPTIDDVTVLGIPGQMSSGKVINPAGAPEAGTVVMYALSYCAVHAADCYQFATISISIAPEPVNRVITLAPTEAPPQQGVEYVIYPQVIDGDHECWAPVLSGSANPGCGGFICDSCYTDPAFVTCPGGDAIFQVYLKDEFGDPIVGFEDVWVEFMNCDDMILCPQESLGAILQPYGPSDDEGIVKFSLAAGNCTSLCQAVVRTSSCDIATVPVRSVDANGDLGVALSNDYLHTTCNDYNDDGLIDFSDEDIFSAHLGHYCGLSECERFHAEFELDPPDNLIPSQVVDLDLILINGNFDYCQVGFVSFFASGFGTGQTEELIETVDYNKQLRPGQRDTVSTTYVVPGIGHGCLTARFTTDCCSTAVQLTQCAQSIWHCTGDKGSFCYTFRIQLNAFPVDSVVKNVNLPGPGWQTHDLYFPASFPLSAVDSVVYDICTPEVADLGDTAAGYTYVYAEGKQTPNLFRNKVVITSRTGDADGNCIINIADAVYIISYIFGGGGEPLPYLAGDVDCNGFVNIADAVYLITYIFGGGPPPCIVGE